MNIFDIPTELLETVFLTEEHMKLALQGDESYKHHMSFAERLEATQAGLTRSLLDNLERLRGKHVWHDLPAYPVPGLNDGDPDSPSPTVDACMGIRDEDQSLILIEVFDTLLSAGDRHSYMRRWFVHGPTIDFAVFRQRGNEGELRIARDTRIICKKGDAQIVFDYQEAFRSSGDAERHKTIERYFKSIFRLERLTKMNAPEFMLADFVEFLEEARRQCAEAFNLEPPHPSNPNFKKLMTEYLNGLGFSPQSVRTLFRGDDIEEGFTWCGWSTTFDRSAGVWKLTDISLKRWDFEPQLEPPATDERVELFKRDFSSLTEASERIIRDDLPRIADYAKRFNDV